MARKPVCPLCSSRRASRACPATGQRICAVCCGTKRLVEIDCPSDCGYLQASQAHPPAAVQRQQERDLLFALPMIQELSPPQQTVMTWVQACLQAERQRSVALADDDVARAARALAQTYETASRGIIYEHTAALPAAERLAEAIKAVIEQARAESSAIRDGDVAAALRRVEQSAGEAAAALPGGDTAYLDWLQRTFRRIDKEASPADDEPRVDDGSRIIVPATDSPWRHPAWRRAWRGAGPRTGGILCRLRQENKQAMARRCELCGKGPVVGRNVSHAHNVTRRRFEPNIQTVRAIVNGGVKRLRVCTRCIRSNRITKAA